MCRLLSLVMVVLLTSVMQATANTGNDHVWRINEVDDPFTQSIKLSVHVEFKTRNSKTQLPIRAALDISSQPNPHSSVEAIALISHISPDKPQPIASPARKISLSVDNEKPVELVAYYQTDRGSAFGTKHWYLFDLDCPVIKAMATGNTLQIDAPEASVIALSGADIVLSQVFPNCFAEAGK